MIAIYTMHDKASNKETQGLSVSYDTKSFVFYDQNPVLTSERSAFRDPQVFYYAQLRRWIMVIALSDDRKVSFYASTDLKHWEHLSDFGPEGAISQVWEVPDLFQLSVDGNPNHKKWVLLCGMGPNREQYFIGDFDGQKFTLDPALNGYLHGQPPVSSNGSERANWLDFGADYYAVRTYRDYDNAENRVVSMGWLGNWEYANDVPYFMGQGRPGAAARAWPANLSRRAAHRPAPHPRPGRAAPGSRSRSEQQVVSQGLHRFPGFKPTRNTYEIDATFEITDPNASLASRWPCMARTAMGSVSDMMPPHPACFSTARTRNTGSSPAVCQVYDRSPGCPEMARVRLHIFVDQSSIEVFANDGDSPCPP